MSPDNLIIVGIIVFLLMSLGMVLTVLEFRSGAPKQQMDDKDKIKNSPHGHVD
jgi:hypothetical protein